MPLAAKFRNLGLRRDEIPTSVSAHKRTRHQIGTHSGGSNIRHWFTGKSHMISSKVQGRFTKHCKYKEIHLCFQELKSFLCLYCCPPLALLGTHFLPDLASHF